MLLWFEGKFGVWSDEKSEGHYKKGLFMDFGFSLLPCTAIHWENLEMPSTGSLLLPQGK